MKKDQLQLAPGLSVPAAIAARTVFVAGTKGSGKTHNAGVMAEEMLAAGVHMVVLDPLGVWWGLRHDAGGGPGGHPVYILGGEHGDAPLPPTSGEVVAEFVVGRGQSVILDMSGFGSNADQDRFVTAFAAKLFRLKAAEKSALHLIMDEADQFMPQQPQSGTEIPLLGATKTIVTKGRSRGLSMTMITQRPQSIAKAAIEEADVVLCHRMQGVNAVKAMRAWTDLYATKEQAAEFFDSLPRLADGECWVWSPQFLKLFERHQIRRKVTFDSSRTPDPGEVARKTKAAAAVDLGKLTAEMQATAEAAKANDPAELKRQLAAAKSELAKAQAIKPAPAPPPEVKIVERPVLKDGQLEWAEKLLERYAAVSAELAQSLTGITSRTKAVEHWRPPAVSPAATPATRTVPSSPPVRPAEAAEVKPAVNAVARDGLSGPHRKILDAVAWWHAVDVAEPTPVQVGLVSGYVASGGSFGTYLSALSTAGLVRRDRGTIALTDAGSAVAERPAGTPTLAELHDRIRGVLLGPHRKLLDAVIEAGPAGLTTDELGERTGYAASGGSFGTYLSKLSSLGLVDRRRGGVSPSAVVFPPTMAG